MQNIILLYNPKSGYFLDYLETPPKPFFESLMRGVVHKNIILFAMEGAYKPQLIELLEYKKVESIWIAGGDGSVLALYQLLNPFRLPIGILPCGTMNLLARDLGISLDIKEAFYQLLNANTQPISVAMLNQNPFLSISNIGISTKLTHYREKFREHNLFIRLTLLLWYMIKFVIIYPKMRIKVKYEGKERRFKTRSITISNNPIANTSSVIPHREALDTHLLGLYIVKENSPLSLPKLIIKLFRRRWRDDRDIEVIHTPAADIQIISRKHRFRVMSDGELNRQKSPFHYAVANETYPFLVPKG